MIEIITKDGIALDLDPSVEFEIEIENPMLNDNHIPVPFSTSISFLPTAKNKSIFGYMDAMLLDPAVKIIDVSIYASGIPLFYGRLEYDGIEDGRLNYTFAGRSLEDEWGAYINKVQHLSNFVTAPSGAASTDYKFLVDIQQGVLDQESVKDAGISLYGDFELPMLVNKNSITEVEYESNNIGRTAVTPDIKYHNYFWNLSDAPVTPAVKVVSILGDIINKLAISEMIKGVVENLAIIAPHRSRPLCALGLQQTDNGRLVLPVADMLPECTIFDLIINIAKIYCASIFRDGDRFVMLTNKEILSSPEVLIWDDKISKEISMSTEPASSYAFSFANDGESSLSTETEMGTTDDSEAEIKDVLGSTKAIETMITAGSSYTTVRENRTGNIYSGRELIVSGKKLSYHDVLLHRDEKVTTNEELEGSFDNSVNFKRVECVPLLILDRNNTSYSPTTYHMCPVVESPTPCSDRPSDVWIGSLIDGQLVGKGFAFRRQEKSGENANLNNVESSHAKLSLDVPVLYRRYHSQFAKWLSTNRRVVTTDVILTLSDISKLRMYNKVCVCNQYFLIKKITHTFSQLFKTISSRVELIACDNIHNEVEEINLVTIQQNNGAVPIFWAQAEHPVETDILIQVKYKVEIYLPTSSTEERETILRIFKGNTKSETIGGTVISPPMIAPIEDRRYRYTRGFDI